MDYVGKCLLCKTFNQSFNQKNVFRIQLFLHCFILLCNYHKNEVSYFHYYFKERELFKDMKYLPQSLC